MRTPNTRENIIKILQSKTTVSPITKCWIHGEPEMNDYSKIRFEGKDLGVHVISAIIYLNYDINSDFQINHKALCLYKNCWNPEHIYIGTQKENVRDSKTVTGLHISNRNSQKTTCPKGHPYDKVNSHGRRICSICQKESNNKSQNKEKRKEYMKEYNKKYHEENYLGYGVYKKNDS